MVLRGDDAAAHRYESTAKPGIEAVSICVGAYQHLLRKHLAARCGHAYPTNLSTRPQNRGVLMHDRICRLGDPQYAGKQLGGVKPTNIHAHEATSVEVGSDVLRYVRACH